MPSKEETVTVNPSIFQEEAATLEKEALTPADRLENSSIFRFSSECWGLFFYSYFYKAALINLDIVNFAFLFLGILFHGTPKRFLAVSTGG